MTTDRQFAVSILCGLCLLFAARLAHTAQQTVMAASFHALTRIEGVTWGDADTVWLSGQSLPVRQFQANDTLSGLAQRFTQTQPQLRRMLVASGSLLLSGMEGPYQLVIQLQASESGVTGFATMLDTSVVQQQGNDSGARAYHVVEDLFPNAMRVFALQQTAGDVTVQQTIHWMETPLATLTPQLDNRLQGLGWQPWRSPSLPSGHAAWQSHGDVLMLLPDSVTQGSLLYQLRQKDRGQP